MTEVVPPGEQRAGTTDPLRGDTASAVHLREMLGGLATQHEGTPTGRLLSDVLAGRRSFSDLSADPAFMDLARSGVEQYRQHLASLDDDERRQLQEAADELGD